MYILVIALVTLFLKLVLLCNFTEIHAENIDFIILPKNMFDYVKLVLW